ncbi:hypothetical protein B0H66DRAFT_546884 [Apodospora peruviana]|uniref:Condensation domain-containing protein n=1 Tax=Apodospora peruviana TaxID=516989 RepID=A0AAE0IGR7_9PEZI|nr:hypothetical protein B0H66DRAFT_546884 [Apodospora peruviana]
MTLHLTHWEEISPGLYQRPIGENERFIRTIGDRAHAFGREQWSVTTISSFSFRATEKNQQDGVDWVHCLREAWKLLRFQHPSIASTATDDGKLQYLVPDPVQLEKWLDETFQAVHDPTLTADDLIANLKPSPTATLPFLSGSSQIVMHTAHWRTDGYGALQLVDAFFDAVQSVLGGSKQPIIWGEEVSRLVPSVETALNLPLEATPDIDTTAREYLATGRYLAGTVGVPCEAGPTVLPRGTRHVHLELGEDITKALQVVCLGHGITMYSAVHAALAAVNFAQSPAVLDGDKHYTSTIRLNLRPHLPAPFNTAAVASGLYTGGYMSKVSASSSFLDRARRYDEEYNNGVTENFLSARRQYAKLACEIVRNSPPPPPISNIDISVVRDADTMVHATRETAVGVLEVSSVDLGVETLTRQTYCFVWVYRGKLQLSLWYNEAYYESDGAMELLEMVRDTLVSELLGTSQSKE